MKPNSVSVSRSLWTKRINNYHAQLLSLSNKFPGMHVLGINYEGDSEIIRNVIRWPNAGELAFDDDYHFESFPTLLWHLHANPWGFNKVVDDEDWSRWINQPFVLLLTAIFDQLATKVHNCHCVINQQDSSPQQIEYRDLDYTIAFFTTNYSNADSDYSHLCGREFGIAKLKPVSHLLDLIAEICSEFTKELEIEVIGGTLSIKRMVLSYWFRYLFEISETKISHIGPYNVLVPTHDIFTWSAKGLEKLASGHSNDNPNEENLKKCIKFKASPKLQKALDFIRSKKTAKGLTIANHLGIELSTFQTHYVQRLKDFGVQNEGDGYFIPEGSR